MNKIDTPVFVYISGGQRQAVGSQTLHSPRRFPGTRAIECKILLARPDIDRATHGMTTAELLAAGWKKLIEFDLPCDTKDLCSRLYSSIEDPPTVATV
jgi:hypothetical protein